MSAAKVVDVLGVIAQAAELLDDPDTQSPPLHVATAIALDAASDAVAELVTCFDAMLARWWSNATDADKTLANRAAAARMRFNGEDFPGEPPIDELLGERRREVQP